MWGTMRPTKPTIPATATLALAATMAIAESPNRARSTDIPSDRAVRSPSNRTLSWRAPTIERTTVSSVHGTMSRISLQSDPLSVPVVQASAS